MSATPAAVATARPGRRRAPAALWVLLVPFLVMFAAFFIAPIVFAIVDSLFSQKSSGLGLGAPTREFVFLDNYLGALSNPSFIASLGRSERSLAIVRAVIGLAHGLGLPALAEGVETADQLATLVGEGCDEVQGFLIGRPRPIEAYAHIVQPLEAHIAQRNGMV